MPPPIVGTEAAEATPDVGWAKLTVPDYPRLSIIAELGERAPTPYQGYGGWDKVDRAGRTALTVWRGFEPLGIELDLILDDHPRGRSIVAARSTLEAMAGRGEDARGGEPPILIVDTAGVMPHGFHVSTTNRWVIDDLDWDEDSVIVNDHGNWTRAAASIQLLQYVTDLGLVAQSTEVRNRLQDRPKNARRVYVVRQGDTLTSIARRKLGDAGRWRELATLNGIRDPRAPLKTGRRIWIP